MQTHKVKIMLLIIVLIGAIFGVTAGVYQKEQLGSMLWSTLHIPAVALFFHNDAVLAIEIGNFYFNVYGDGVYDLEKAGHYFERALALDPRVPDAWHQLARIDFLNGKFDDALYKINKQIDLHEDSFMASYYIRGLIYGYRKEFKKAEEDFLVFLEWSPRNWAAHNDLAWIYFQNEEYQKTADMAQRGLAYTPNNAWLLNMKGIALLNLEEKDTARSLFGRALSEAKLLTPADWELAYPGNDPRVAKQGLAEIITAIEFNLRLTVD